MESCPIDAILYTPFSYRIQEKDGRVPFTVHIVLSVSLNSCRQI